MEKHFILDRNMCGSNFKL
ncbi:hypothetical protein [Clostridium botulinum]